MRDLQKHCKEIAEKLNNGIVVSQEDIDYSDYPYEIGDILSGFDYIKDALEITYHIDSEGEYLGARILVAFGGPNIWIDTRDMVVFGAWWGDSGRAVYGEDAMDIDGACREIYECTR